MESYIGKEKGYQTDNRKREEKKQQIGKKGGGRAGFKPVILAGMGGGLPPIQRLVGFEAELSVPVYRPVSGEYFTLNREVNQPPDGVKTFLFGNVSHNMQLKQTRHFTLTTDHGALLVYQHQIFDELVKHNYISSDIAGMYCDCGILEYVTPAENESKRLGRNRLKSHMEYIRKDGVKALGKVGDCMAPLEGGMLTGVPIAEFREWMGNDYEIIQHLLERFAEIAKSDYINLQATAGIFPSRMSALMVEYAPEEITDENVSNYSNIQLKLALMGGARYHNEFKDEPYINSLGSNLDSFLGIIHVLYMYMIGEAINCTELNPSTPKNCVAFLVKLSNMHDMISKAAPSLAENRPDLDFAARSYDFLASQPFATKDWWMRMYGVRERSPGQHIMSREDFINILLGQGDLAVIASGHTFEEPDRTAGRLGRSQQGVQMEYRNIRGVSLANLIEVSAGIMEQVRRVNLED